LDKQADMLNSKIKDFLKQAKAINHDVFINLQGYPYFFKLLDFNHLEFEMIRKNPQISNSLFLWDYTNFKEKGFSLESGFPLFRPIVDGVEIATDQSGRLYEIKYFPRDSKKEHSINIICESIDELLKDGPLKDQPKDKEGNIILHRVSRLSEVLSPKQMESIYKFSDVDFTIDDYIHTLETVIKNSDASIQISNTSPTGSKTFKLAFKGLNIDFLIDFQLGKGEWTAHLVEQINKELTRYKQQMRFALVHENSWEELYGLAIFDKKVYDKLKKVHLIKEAP
jgi:hypothetical protein